MVARRVRCPGLETKKEIELRAIDLGIGTSDLLHVQGKGGGQDRRTGRVGAAVAARAEEEGDPDLETGAGTGDVLAQSTGVEKGRGHGQSLGTEQIEAVI
mmetsp:Transcript_38074/g.74874  ORF Transcript_38074/g.74874 Transcript_38074/m.74874 type:complete len:100 (-) Transcript_38074:366-665(-)